MKNLLSIIVLVLFIMSCGGGGDSSSGPVIAEQSDYFDGTIYHRFYRYEEGVGYATSTDGINFVKYAGNPVIKGPYVFPVLVYDDILYLIVRNHSTGEYGLYDVSIYTKPSFIRIVLTGDYCNMAVSVVDGVWNALIEGHDGDYFFLMSSIMDSDGVFRSFTGFRGDAGNPTLEYIPERNAILALYGADYRATGVWRIRSGVYNIATKTWKDMGVILSKTGVHLADPDLGIGNNTKPLLISIGYAQNSVATYKFAGTKMDLYDAIVNGDPIVMEDLGVTMLP